MLWVRIAYPCRDCVYILAQGRPHFRRFRLTSDLTRLVWESSKKVDATVLITQISEIKLGQKTQNFKRNPLPQFESCSFSLIYGERSLDIVCKDKKEFLTWTTGLTVSGCGEWVW